MRFIAVILLNFIFFSNYAQYDVPQLGIQYKPIISADIIGTGQETIQSGNINFQLQPNNGFSFGMLIRQRVSKQINLESGINYTKRNFDLTISNDTNGFVGESDFSYIIYELPITALVFVQVGELTYLNSALGVSLNFLPSDWESFDTYFTHFSNRESWIIPSLLANFGAEYRSRDGGTYYAGLSFHLPFNDLTVAGVGYRENNLEKENAFFDVSGNYFTLDLRYYFKEDPSWKQKRERRQ